MDTRPLFGPLEQMLVDLLHSLKEDEWNLPTVAGLWTVRDVAAHLLDTAMRHIARVRDGYIAPPGTPIHSNEDLVRYINSLNAQFVQLMRRFSTKQLLELTTVAAPSFVDCIENEQLDSPSPFGVSWAGEQTSANWFHIAREYTERWHHQQQIRDATGKPGILNQRFGRPALEIFLRAVPFTYRNVDAENGTELKIAITGDAGFDSWLIKNNQWELTDNYAGNTSASIRMPDATAWKLLTKSWREKDARSSSVMEGDATLIHPFFSVVAVVA
ncbi:MAG: maleylpyruvate isomerase family mycothiol-dependent enzyme [Bacteroidota bacterium]|nr:maleylpyruvate isomerase family mycothiol-dependent enzyme [Bacteroidota bacterium]